MAFLCQQCTLATTLHHRIINKEWKPGRNRVKLVCKPWRLQSRKTNLLICATASSSEGSAATAPSTGEDNAITASSTGEDVTVPSTGEEGTASSTGEQAQEPIFELLTKLELGETSEPPKNVAQTREARASRISLEELVKDKNKVLTGTVRAVMPYGAFVDLGATSDGLLHISKLGKGFVKSVESVLKVGQEVKVLVEQADLKSRKIQLKMYISKEELAEQEKEKKEKEPTTVEDEILGVKIPRQKIPPRNTKWEPGNTVTGNVTAFKKKGCVVTLQTGEEAFLPTRYIDPRGNVRAEKAFELGQEITARVFFIDSKINLTMIHFGDDFNGPYKNPSINDVYTSPFALAFRENPVIRKYLEESGKLEDCYKNDPKRYYERQIEERRKKLDAYFNPPSEENGKDAEKQEEVSEQGDAEKADTEGAKDGGKTEDNEVIASVAESKADETITEEDRANFPMEEVIEDKAPTGAVNEAVEDDKSQEDEITIPVAEGGAGQDDETSPVENKDEEAAIPVAEKIEEKADYKAVEEEKATPAENKTKEATAPVAENIEAEKADAQAEVENKVDEEKVEAKEASSNGSPIETEADTAKSTISASLVKQLRQESGAGMMDCKKALVATNGDFEQAVEYLRKKGLAGADKKASRIAAEGAIGSYVHDGRIGVLLEVNCETDFVSRGELFSQLVEDLGMQLAACQQVEYVSVEEVPEEVKSKEFEIEMQREDLQSKPEAIRTKIVEGRVTKRLAEMTLLDQPFIKDENVLVKDLVRQAIASVGEKIQVRRFARYILGEGLEKRTYDIAAEVAAQAKAQEEKIAQEQEKEKSEDEKVSSSKPDEAPQVSISASLVKQLREETGTGMMECKKALVECKGDIEQAKEYLRKKGLASAEKKAGRIAAEGLVVSYVHTSRIGVLMEVNSETDFVARNSVFKELAEDLAMQVVACPLVEYVSVDDIPSEVKERERQLEMQREDLMDKPEQIRAKIVEGRLSKLLADRALLEQAYLKDDSITVKDLLKKTTVSLGENIRVRRFVRFNLGEGIEKKVHNLAEEVAALNKTS